MFIVDRFEEDWAVVENEQKLVFKLPVHLLPPDIKEGDVLNICITRNEKATESRKEQAVKKMEKLFEE